MVPRPVFFLVTVLAFCALIAMVEMLVFAIAVGDSGRLSLQADMLLIGLWASGALLIAALVATWASGADPKLPRRRSL